ncbi:MAG: NADP-dependent oxidoreductase [Steroidobacteraceae bacterium]|nr:NADP-dependent oxidoreductase [Steroidobacteraceae bacterium]
MSSSNSNGAPAGSDSRQRELAVPPRNRQWRVARRPEAGEPVGAHNFEFGEAGVPRAADGEILVRTLLLGTSPAQRSYITSGVGMHAKLRIGDVMRGRGLGLVVESRHADFAPGDIVNASLGWQDYAVLQPTGATGTILDIYKVPDPQTPLSVHLGIIGSAGLTGYFGLRAIAQAAAGDRVLISAAAGGVGSAAGQIAKVLGCEVVGLAGSDDKCRWLVDYVGYDAAINYRTEPLDERLTALFPDGADVYFDNVGGDILNTALDHLALKARVVICGLIATDYAPGPRRGPANYTRLLRKRARMEGFFVQDHVADFPRAESQLRTWYRDGRLKPVEDVSAGLETMPDCLGSLFAGTNRGVRICEVAALPDGAQVRSGPPVS